MTIKPTFPQVPTDELSSKRSIYHYNKIVRQLIDSEIPYEDDCIWLVIQLANSLSTAEQYERHVIEHGPVMQSKNSNGEIKTTANPAATQLTATKAGIKTLLEQLYFTPKAKQALKQRVIEREKNDLDELFSDV
jgi:phage terminase small subunit